MRQWVADFTDEEVKPVYLVRRANWDDQQARGYEVMDLSGVLDVVWDVAYGDTIGEPYDTFTVWLLSADGPLPARVDQYPHIEIGKVEVRVMYQPKGKRSWALVETGYRNMVEV